MVSQLDKANQSYISMLLFLSVCFIFFFQIVEPRATNHRAGGGGPRSGLMDKEEVWCLSSIIFTS